MQNLIKYLPEQKLLGELPKWKSEYNNLSEPEQFAVVVSSAAVDLVLCHDHLCFTRLTPEEGLSFLSHLGKAAGN